MSGVVLFRHQNDGLAEEASIATSIVFDPSEDLAIQSAKDDADINVIVKRFGVTGQLGVPNVEPFYGDFSEVEDYQTAMNRVLEADRAFMQLSSDVRNKFRNDPARLIEFLADPENRDEARELGLLRPEDVIPAPMRVEVVNPPAPVDPPEA